MRKQWTIYFLGICLALTGLCTPEAQKVVCIDAGHGGTDPGAVGWGLQEKNINLDVTNRLMALMKNAGWQVKLTRSNDSTVSLSSRTDYANSVGADRFVSIHCNAFNQTAHGTETYCYTEGSTTSFRMRDKVNPLVVAALNTYNRGCKTANFYVVKYTNMPAILCELAFIDNQADAAKLGDGYYRQKAAEAIKNGLVAANIADRNVATTGNFYLAPRWSPDGSQLLVSGANYRGLYVINRGDGQMKAFSQEQHVGYNANWASDNEIAYSQVKESESARFMASLSGVRSLGSLRARDEVAVFAADGEIWVEQAGQKSRLTQGGDTFFNPVMSPNKQLVAYEGLATGLHVTNLNGSFQVNLGVGNHPCWTPDSQKIVFDVAQDNGEQITQSDLWLVLVAKPDVRINLTQGRNLQAQRPSISADGTRIAFDANGKIFVAAFEETVLAACEELKISE